MKVIYIHNCSECPYAYRRCKGNTGEVDVCGHIEVMSERKWEEREVGGQRWPHWCPLQDYVHPNSVTIGEGA